MSVEIIRNAPLSKYTFYGVGGPVDELYKVSDIENLRELWTDTVANKIPKIILGKGSNLLFSDKGFRGRVFILTFEAVAWRDNFVTVEAGKNFQDLVEETAKKGWSDLEKLSGIPGNFGGFVRGNAGAFGSEVSDFLESVEFIDEAGNLRTLKCDECEFTYRESIFKKNPDWVIVRGTLKFEKKDDPDAALGRVRKLVADRWEKYPPGKSGGSFFKNPVPGEVFAGKLLEESGAKGDRIGNAEISKRHANFFLNVDGKATQSDILALARKWKKIVVEKFDYKLEPEIFICDELGKRIEL